MNEIKWKLYPTIGDFNNKKFFVCFSIKSSETGGCNIFTIIWEFHHLKKDKIFYKKTKSNFICELVELPYYGNYNWKWKYENNIIYNINFKLTRYYKKIFFLKNSYNIQNIENKINKSDLLIHIGNQIKFNNLKYKSNKKKLKNIKKIKKHYYNSLNYKKNINNSNLMLANSNDFLNLKLYKFNNLKLLWYMENLFIKNQSNLNYDHEFKKYKIPIKINYNIIKIINKNILLICLDNYSRIYEIWEIIKIIKNCPNYINCIILSLPFLLLNNNLKFKWSYYKYEKLIKLLKILFYINIKNIIIVYNNLNVGIKGYYEYNNKKIFFFSCCLDPNKFDKKNLFIPKYKKLYTQRIGKNLNDFIEFKIIKTFYKPSYLFFNTIKNKMKIYSI